MCEAHNSSVKKSVRVRLHANFDDPDVLGQGLAAAAHEEGVVMEVLKALGNPTSEEAIPEKYMQEILDRANARYRKGKLHLFDSVQTWYAAKVKEVTKANIPDFANLTPDQLEELRTLMRAQFWGKAVIGIDLQRLFDSMGITYFEWDFLMDSVRETFLVGKFTNLMHLATTGADYEDLIIEAQKKTLLRHEQLALDASLRNTRMHLRKLWDGISEDVYGTVSRYEARQVSKVINQYMEGGLPKTTYTPRGGAAMTEAERAAVRGTKIATTEPDLRSELWHYFKDDPLNRDRDWWRVAVTETRAANGIGRLMQVKELGHDKFYFLVQPDACKQCKQAYLNADGSPKIFSVDAVLTHALETHGMNIDREHKGLPNASLHPHCNCIPLAHVEDVEPIRIHDGASVGVANAP